MRNKGQEVPKFPLLNIEISFSFMLLSIRPAVCLSALLWFGLDWVKLGPKLCP